MTERLAPRRAVPVHVAGRRALLAGAGLLSLAPAAARAQSRPTDAQRAARWAELRGPILDGRPTAPAGDLVTLTAPDRALDAALVPISLSVERSVGAKALWLVIDENPSPLVARVAFGPAADIGAFSTRVRVESYSHVRAVVEAADGRLLEASHFVRAAGGCAAPVGGDLSAARARMGRMRFRAAGPVEAGRPVPVQVAISHPNTSGLQRDQLTLLQIPADFVRSVRVTHGGALVLEADTDISIAEDPTLGFVLAADRPAGELVVEAADVAGRRFRQAWQVGGAA